MIIAADITQLNSHKMEKEERLYSVNNKALMKELFERIEALENIVFQSKEVLNLEEAAIFIGCTRSMLYKMTHERTIPFYKPSGKLVYFER